MKVTLTIHKNTDASLPGSHLVEVRFNVPADLPGKDIEKLSRIFIKPAADVQGRPLVGAEAKITDGFFWIALSAASADVEANLALLRQGDWLDLPFTYKTGQRAILTFQKGTAGDRVFHRAMAAWSDDTVAASGQVAPIIGRPQARAEDLNQHSNLVICEEGLNYSRDDWNLRHEGSVAEAKRRHLSVGDCRVALGLPASAVAAQKTDQSAITAPTHTAHRVALVIGNAAYASVSPLKNPRNDAELVGCLRGHRRGIRRALGGAGYAMQHSLEFMRSAGQQIARRGRANCSVALALAIFCCSDTPPGCRGYRCVSRRRSAKLWYSLRNGASPGLSRGLIGRIPDR
jgi:hypothetical protein